MGMYEEEIAAQHIKVDYVLRNNLTWEDKNKGNYIRKYISEEVTLRM